MDDSRLQTTLEVSLDGRDNTDEQLMKAALQELTTHRLLEVL